VIRLEVRAARWAVSLEDSSGRLRGRVLRWRPTRLHPLVNIPTSSLLAECAWDSCPINEEVI
jgi:hypothetical protein